MYVVFNSLCSIHSVFVVKWNSQLFTVVLPWSSGVTRGAGPAVSCSRENNVMGRLFRMGLSSVLRSGWAVQPFSGLDQVPWGPFRETAGAS